MKLTELDPTVDFDSINYSSVLNPVLWKGDVLHSDVEEILRKNADSFIEFLAIDRNVVLDIVITGSSANYNWTKYSDVDLHIIVDMDALQSQCEAFIEEYLDSKRRLWNLQHDVQIKGHQIECYPESNKEVHISSGVYSLMQNTWIKEPKYDSELTWDSSAVKIKATDLYHQIDDIVKSGSEDTAAIEKIKDKIVKMRRNGLASKGEFSVENLAFKVLRNSGVLEQLFSCYTDSIDSSLSLESLFNED